MSFFEDTGTGTVGHVYFDQALGHVYYEWVVMCYHGFCIITKSRKCSDVIKTGLIDYITI